MSLAEVFERVATADAPVEFTAYDGSHAGVRGADVRFDIRSPYAVSYLVQSRGALGACSSLYIRAYRCFWRYVYRLGPYVERVQ
jgi:hypothetical protein